nr:putative thiamine biosynthetic bifunctional enzyme [Quercus suber]
MAFKNIDYSLYLVTDSTAAILGEKNLTSVVQAAVSGVTIVQLRDKTADTGALVRVAKALHKVTRAAGIPLVINDRVDVALAAGVEGVHVGQDDLDYKTARLILGENAIIGVTANNEREAVDAARDGADYLGIGTVFATPTKENTKSIIGTAGVQRILNALVEKELGHVKTVCIGGINMGNAQRVLYQTTTAEKRLDGVAVVSAIMAAQDPKDAASSLRKLIVSPPPFATSSSQQHLAQNAVLAKVSSTIRRMAEKKPLCHNMTNLVVQNFAANVALAIGSSPIMSNNGLEAADLAALGGSLVINMGTTTPDVRSNHLQALVAYNAVGGPTLLDPVGAGATQQRRDGVKALMAGGYFDVMKGNEGEIRTIFGVTDVKQHGVDSGASQLSIDEKITLVKATAARERNIVLMTGNVDVLSDGEQTVLIKNGHILLGEVTGSGCALGTTIASVLAVERKDKLLAVLSAMLMYEIAAERAAGRADVRGPGTFIPAFIDELYLIRLESLKADSQWVGRANVKLL